MQQLPVLAYGFATTFKTKDLVSCFAGATVRSTKKQIVAEYGSNRFAFAFDFGAIVFINVGSEERARVLGTILSNVATEEPHSPLEEDFLVEIDPSAPHHLMHFERVVVPELSVAIAELIALLIAQSVSIDYYEEDLQEIIAALDLKTDHMAKTGKILESTRELARFVGSSIATKNQIIAALALLDKPLGTWEAEPLDRLYRDFRNMLEIEERFRALEYKLRTIQETLELFLDLSQSRRMLFLEATIVLLIVFEIVLTLLTKFT